MAIPDYQTCMLPFLRFLEDGKEHTLREAEDSLAEHFGLSQIERAELLPSGQQGIFKNRIGWARTYLKKSGLIEATKRGVFKITARGTEILSNAPAKIDVKFLEQFPEFIEFRDASRTNVEPIETKADFASENTPISTPEELIEIAHQSLREQLAQEFLARLLSCSPTFFEQVVVELLVKMGYGGSRRGAGERLGQTGDGGVDGVIKEDHLDSILSSFRPSGGRALLEDPKYKNSSVHYKVNVPGRAYSSLHLPIRQMRLTMLHVSIRK
jgi:restriction system protein